jgi:hypothetical protein
MPIISKLKIVFSNWLPAFFKNLGMLPIPQTWMFRSGELKHTPLQHIYVGLFYCKVVHISLPLLHYLLEEVQKVRFPLRGMTSVMAGVEYGIQPKSPILT